MRLTHAGLFEGYGGTTMAAALALGPLDTRWVSEIKPAALALHQVRYPDVENVGDITAAFPDDLDRAALPVEPVDLVSASWPCQPHSSAGKRLGEADPRALWPNVARYLAEARPAIFVGENVARITGNGELRRVVRTLADLGYVGSWRSVRASDVDACHRRDRCFVVAVRPDVLQPGHRIRTHLDELGYGAAVHADLLGRRPDGGDLPAGQPDVAGRGELTLLPTPTARDQKGPSLRPPRTDGYARSDAQLDLPAAVALLPTPGERLGSQRGVLNPDTAALRFAQGRRNLDDAVALLPTPRAVDGTKGALLDRDPAGHPRRGTDDLPTAVGSLLPTPRESDGGKGGPSMRFGRGGPGLPSAVLTEIFGGYAPAIARHERALGRPAPDPTIVGANGRPVLSPWFVEWMMALPAGWVCDVVDLGQGRAAGWRTRALSLLGDGVVPAQGGYAYRFLLEHLVAVHG